MIHASAVVDPSAQIGAGTKIWSHACVGAKAIIGKNCTVGHAVYIDREVRLGDEVWVHSKASIYRPVEIGDRVFIGPHVVFVNDADPTPSHVRDLSGVSWRVETGATVGANATILSDVSLAQGCFIGAGAVVTRTTRRFGVYAGVPARLIGFRCVCGWRHGPQPAPRSCPQCQTEF